MSLAHGPTHEPPRAPHRAPAILALVALALLGATSLRATEGTHEPPPDPHPRQPPIEAPRPQEEVEPSISDAEPPAAPEAGEEKARPSLREICRLEQNAEGAIEEGRRILAETFCGATLWIDGLLGGTPDVYQAQRVTGHVQVGSLHTEFDGFDFNGRLRVNYDFPNLERRLRLFVGREPEDEFISDRQQVPAIRSSVFGLEGAEEWLAGFGYSPPGRFSRRLDFRVGGRVRSAPEIFAQTRYRHQIFVGEDAVWRFRETFFWASQQGVGFTTGIDYDRVLRPDLLFRWGNVGTLSEASDGFEWRSGGLLYFNLRSQRAVAGEIFTRGATGRPVDVREYGARAIYRQPLARPYLMGEFIVGYTWPREERHQERDGSLMLGFGVELRFGREY